MLKDLGQVGWWMSSEGLREAGLDEDVMAAFLVARRAAGHCRVLGPRGLAPLLSYLREAGVTPAAKPSQAPLAVLLAGYRTWLLQERGLATATVLRYQNTACRFFQQQAMSGEVFDPATLTGLNVNTFLLEECGRVSAGSAKGRVAELRSILRYLYLRGITALRLGTSVPPVGGWRLATLPATMAAADVQLLLDSCDRSTRVGVRNFAIMTLVGRLGLRSIEVARLQLGDVDWRAGELVVRGKARRLHHRDDVRRRRPGLPAVGNRRAADRAVGVLAERLAARQRPQAFTHHNRHAVTSDVIPQGVAPNDESSGRQASCVVCWWIQHLGSRHIGYIRPLGSSITAAVRR